jgi:hypothetical protein
MVPTAYCLSTDVWAQGLLIRRDRGPGNPGSLKVGRATWEILPLEPLRLDIGESARIVFTGIRFYRTSS